MPTDLPPDLRELAWLQRGALTTRQAIEGGLTMDLLRSRVHQGIWQRPHCGVYVVFSGRPDRQAAQWAAVLRAGRGAMLSYHSAAELAGLGEPGRSDPRHAAGRPAHQQDSRRGAALV